MDLGASIKSAALEAGFDVAGIASVRAEDFPELARFSAWIDNGHAGEMDYLARRDDAGKLKRASLQTAAPWARSVIVCALSYDTPQPLSIDDPDPARGWIARYAWTREDYHDSVLRRLRVVEARLHDLFRKGSPSALPHDAASNVGVSAPAGLRTWCYVDTGPVVERVYAKYAGVGWIAKNTCIINERIGSFTFLGVILTSLELTPDAPAPDRCGTCTRCIDACPTAAFVGPYELDARRCISYLTIEKRGAVPDELRAGIGRQIFGCDICQDVCPWNKKARKRMDWVDTGDSPVSPDTRHELINPELDRLASLTEEEFRAFFRGSPVKRAKFSGMRRNLAIAMGNSGRREFASRLAEWSDSDDSNLAAHARWALQKLAANSSASR